MKIVKNMGLGDRYVRVILAVVLLTLFYADIPGGTTGIIMAGLAGIFLVTSLVGNCPLYFPFGIRTIKK